MQVGAGRPYQHVVDSFGDIDPRRPVYPIRGSDVAYVCAAAHTPPQVAAGWGDNRGTTCTTSTGAHRRAGPSVDQRSRQVPLRRPRSRERLATASTEFRPASRRYRSWTAVVRLVRSTPWSDGRVCAASLPLAVVIVVRHGRAA